MKCKELGSKELICVQKQLCYSCPGVNAVLLAGGGYIQKYCRCPGVVQGQPAELCRESPEAQGQRQDCTVCSK